MQKEKVFVFNSHPITFNVGDAIMINATEMAKYFGKRPADWLNNQYAKDFIDTYTKVRKSVLTDLVIVKYGGNNNGTWMHEDIALEFARWLSPHFAIWCNDRIKELLNVGITATPEVLEKIINDPDLVIGLATKLKVLRDENAILKLKAEFTEKVFEMPDLVDIGQVAKILHIKGLGRNNLFKRLRQDEIFFMYRNEPKQQYVNAGYFVLKEKLKNGFIVKQTYATQKGLDFILKKYGGNNLLNVA